MRKNQWALLYALAASTLLSSAVLAQRVADGFPAKPVTVIAPYGPGGPNDRESRLTTGKMSEVMGQPFVVDFKPGAGTMLGTALAAKARPDGYTLFVVTASFTMLPAFYKDLSFDTVRDFAPISLVNRRTNVLVVSPSFPAKDYGEFIAYVRANPGKVNFATSGSGGSGHFGAEWLQSLTKTKVTLVHYKQVANLIPDLTAGRVDALLTGVQFALPLITSGKLKALAVTDEERSNLLPGVKTIGEQGLPAFSYITWQGYAAPAGTPVPLINRLSEAFAKAARSPDVAAVFEAEGGAPVGSTPEQFRQVIVTETERWKKLAQENGIKPE